MPPEGTVTSDQLADVITVATLAMVEDDPLKHLRKLEEINEMLLKMGEEDTARIGWEMVILYMFIATEICQVNNIPVSVLDKFHRKIYALLGEAGLVTNKECEEIVLSEFEELVNQRYSSYYEALRNKAGAGPLWNLGEIATKNMFDEMHLVLPLAFANLFVNYGKFIKNTINNYQLENEDRDVQK